MQKNALHVSVSFRPRALARKPGPTERPGSGMGWLRAAPGHRRTTAPLGRGAATGLERCWRRRQTLPEQEAGLLTVSCLRPLSVLLHLLLACTACFKHATKRANAQDWDPALRLHLSNMPHRRVRCHFQTCHKQGSHTLNENLLERAPTTPDTVFAHIMCVYLYN